MNSNLIYDTFRNLDRLFKFRFIIKTKSPLLIKAAENKYSVSDKHMEFIRDENNRIYIPGSSLKGFFRINSERLAKSLGIDVCDIIHNSCINKNFNPNINKDQTDFDPKTYKLCDICELFGSSGMASRIIFEDSYLIGDPSFDRRVGIAVNRKTQSVYQGPFTFETLITGSKFSLNFTIRKFTITDLALVQLVRMAASKGLIQIGGFKSKGYGYIEIIQNDSQNNNNNHQNNNNNSQMIIIGSQKNNIIYSNGEKFFDINNNEFYIPIKRKKLSQPNLETIKIDDKPLIINDIESMFEITLSNNAIDTILKSSLETYINKSKE
ncbi:MAG: RAMP superfamily CRISPR-associated protein [Candidatus Helarchaeota archaeon]